MAQRKTSIEKGISYKPRHGRCGPRPELQGPRPHLWITGPDPRRHEQYKAWLMHKAQANYRGEKHELSFEDWELAWNKNGAWENRGRLITDLCMVRIDSEGAWHKDNIAIIPRSEQLVYYNEKKIGRKYKKRSDTGKKRGPYAKKSNRS